MKKLNNKLSLKKETVVELCKEEMNQVKGGQAQVVTSVFNCTGWTYTAGSTRSSDLCICGG